jgi:predicted methyltransferase
MLRITDLAHLILQPVLRPGSIAIDATVGNGHDTLWLARAVGPTGHVYGFDIQAQALASARQRLTDYTNVTLFECGHEQLTARLPRDAHHSIATVMFNLGYLPGGSKEAITQTETTLAALSQALDQLEIGGRASVVLYPGHPGGDQEAAAVQAFVEQLTHPFAAMCCRRINADGAPSLMLIEKLK